MTMAVELLRNAGEDTIFGTHPTAWSLLLF